MKETYVRLLRLQLQFKKLGLDTRNDKKYCHYDDSGIL